MVTWSKGQGCLIKGAGLYVHGEMVRPNPSDCSYLTKKVWSFLRGVSDCSPVLCWYWTASSFEIPWIRAMVSWLLFIFSRNMAIRLTSMLVRSIVVSNVGGSLGRTNSSVFRMSFAGILFIIETDCCWRGLFDIERGLPVGRRERSAETLLGELNVSIVWRSVMTGLDQTLTDSPAVSFVTSVCVPELCAVLPILFTVASTPPKGRGVSRSFLPRPGVLVFLPRPLPLPLPRVGVFSSVLTPFFGPTAWANVSSAWERSGELTEVAPFSCNRAAWKSGLSVGVKGENGTKWSKWRDWH